MNADILASQFRFNHAAVKANVEGLTHEDSLRQPAPAGNRVNWVVGHILASRNRIFTLLGEGPAWDPAAAARYARGSAPLKDGALAPRLEALLDTFDRSQERLLGALGRAKQPELEKPIDGPLGAKTLGESLALLQFHEAYHAGQTGLLRRLAGKEGAIR